MKSPVCTSLCMLSLSVLCISSAYAEEDYRLWTSKVGSTLEATLESATDDTVTLKRPDGTTVKVPLGSLSQFDQDLVKKSTGMADPFAEQEQPQAPAAEAPELPKDFPKDPLLEAIPWLKKLSSSPLKYEVTDFKTGKKLNQDSFKGKYVYLHTNRVLPNMGTNRLTMLKLLHEKYSADGFVIISLIYQAHPGSYSDQENFKNAKEIKKYFETQLEDYGVNWTVDYSTELAHPLAKKVSKEIDFGWLIGPDGKLIHSKINEYGYRTTAEGSISLPDALTSIFRK